MRGFFPDGKKVVTASWDGTIKIWDSQTGELRETLEPKFRERVNFVQVSPDGTQILATADDNFAVLLDLASGSRIVLPHDSFVSFARFSPDGRFALTVSHDHLAKIFDVKTGNVLSLLTGHGDAVVSGHFSHDGFKLVTASWDKTVKIWVPEGYEVLTEKDRAAVDEYFREHVLKVRGEL